MSSTARIQSWLASDPIAITGSGCVSCAGTGVPALWAAVMAGRAAGQWENFSGTRLAVASAGMLPRHPLTGKVDRSVHMALLAANEAWSQAGAPGIEPEKVSVVAGTSRGPHDIWNATADAVESGRRLLPRLVTAGTVAALSGAIARHCQATGPGCTVSATCASGAAAIAAAADLLLLGRAEMVIAGGADAPLNAGILCGMESAGVVGRHSDPSLACRPFDEARNGMLPAEGAAFLVMERLSHARARGASVIGLLSGWAMATEGEGRSGVPRDGHTLSRVMDTAMATAGLRPDQISYLNAHGTGTQLNDHAEAAALTATFLSPPPVSSTKAVTGHSLGASPAIEAVICLEALRHQWLPGSVNTLAPAFPLPFVPPAGRPGDLRHTLSASLGFWGYHAALVISSPP